MTSATGWFNTTSGKNRITTTAAVAAAVADNCSKGFKIERHRSVAALLDPEST